MGKGEEMRDALFQAKFVKGIDIIESFATIENAASSIGLGEDFIDSNISALLAK